MIRCPRRAALLLLAAALPILSACREVSQPALEGSLSSDVLVPVQQSGDWGYATGNGTLAIAPQFERAYHFVEGRALIRRDGRYGFIDTSGAAVIPPTYAAARPFSGEGLAPVRPDSLWGFVDREGRMVIEPRFRWADRASGDSPPTVAPDSLPPAQGGSGPTLVPPTRAPAYFSEGRARVRRDGRWGFVDRSGTLVIPPRFAHAWDFRDGLARVRFADGQTGYVARDGAVVWPPTKRP
ncbi:MAG: WG repeat-containing protein [Salinibacter sp.]